MIKIISRSAEDTLKIGKKLAKTLQKGDIICLFGNLGAGKTVLTKGLALGLGIKKEQVISPTFVLIRQYRSKLPLYHFDLYRINAAQEIFSLGYEDYFYDEAVTVIEWADRLKQYLPDEYLKVEISIKKEKTRLLNFTGFGRRYQDKLKALKRIL